MNGPSAERADFDHCEDKMTAIRMIRAWGAYKVPDALDDSDET